MRKRSSVRHVEAKPCGTLQRGVGSIAWQIWFLPFGEGWGGRGRRGMLLRTTGIPTHATAASTGSSLVRCCLGPTSSSPPSPANANMVAQPVAINIALSHTQHERHNGHHKKKLKTRIRRPHHETRAHVIVASPVIATAAPMDQHSHCKGRRRSTRRSRRRSSADSVVVAIVVFT